MKVPTMLRKWLVFHFYFDYAVAIPIFIGAEQIPVFFPEYPLDTVALRIVAAALFGIGYSSLQASELDYPSMVKKITLGSHLVWNCMVGYFDITFKWRTPTQLAFLYSLYPV